MKKLFIPLLSITLLLASCGTSTDSSSIPSSSGQSEPTSTSIISSSEDSSSEKIEYKTNPMEEPYVARQYYLNHIGDIYSVWKQYRGDGQTIAVIDEGFNGKHEDFTFEDGTSKVSPDSAFFVTNGDTTSVEVGIDKVDAGEASHGTFCAGIAAAGINKKGVVGIAPNAKLLLLKTDLKPKSIVKAMKYAADHGANVISISIGSYSDYVGDLKNDGSKLTTVFKEPVKYCYDRNVPVISAAGNGGLDGNPTKYTYPGSTDKVIGVGGLAANSSSDIWEGSSYNSSELYRFIDVLAPSENMFGCCNYGGKKYDGGTWMGTSFAAPQVAGMAALYFQKNPGATVKQFETDLYNSCHKIDDSGHYGSGRVDVGKLLGVINEETVQVRIKASWTSVYVYAWNLEKEKELKAWPGKKLTKTNNEYVIEIKPSEYDSIVINDGGNNKSPDLYVTSFTYEKAYALNSSPISENDFLIGKYL